MQFLAGEATGKGFYSYDDNGEANPDHEIQNYIEKSRNISGTQLDPEVFFSQ